MIIEYRNKPCVILRSWERKTERFSVSNIKRQKVFKIIFKNEIMFVSITDNNLQSIIEWSVDEEWLNHRSSGFYKI